MYSCAKRTLLPLEQGQRLAQKITTGTVEGEFCTQADSLANRTNIISIVDLSGSNNSDNGFPSDGDGINRFQGLLDALNDEVQNPHRSYTGFGFHCPNCQDRKNDGLTPIFPGLLPGTPFTNDLDVFRNAVNSAWDMYRGAGSEGNTPYRKAFLEAIRIITLEAQKAKDLADNGGDVVTTDYVIAFTSDGAPTDLDGNALEEFSELVTPTLQILRALPSDPVIGAYISSVVINTAYYYHPDDPDAGPNTQPYELLELIADFGGGEFYPDSKINWKKLMSVNRKKVNREIDYFYVDNKNIIVDRETLTYSRDSDEDGLSDAFELRVGSDPNNRDSDGNGASDKVENIVNFSGLPCLGLEGPKPSCSPQKALQLSGCFDPQGKLLDDDHDGLSNCDELLLGLDPLDYDSNSDTILDSKAVLENIPATPKESQIGKAGDPNGDLDGDGVSNRQEIIDGTPPKIHNASLIGIKPQTYTFGPNRAGEYDPLTGITCYQVKVEDIPILGAPEDNIIELVIASGEQNFQGRRFFRRARVQLKSPYAYGTFTKDDFEGAYQDK
jgi:hypothetical protein